MTKNTLLVSAALALSATSLFGGITFHHPGAGANYVITAKNASQTHSTTLNPAPAAMLSGASAAVQAELPVGDTDFSQYNYDFTSLWGTLGGDLYVDFYRAKWVDDFVGGGEINVRYVRAGEDGFAPNIWFLQLITTNDPLCSPSGARGCGGGNPVGPYIDPYRNDDPAPENDPFYYNSGDVGPHQGGANFDYDYYDFSKRNRSVAPMPKSWRAELYLVNLSDDLVGGKKTIQFLDGIEWGWTMQPVPEPGTYMLFGTGFALLAIVRRRLR